MRAYVIRRVLLVIPTLFIVTLLVFLSVRFIPGDIIDVMTARVTFSGSGSIDEEALKKRLGLDKPVHVQYAKWIGDIVLRGTLGHSLYSGSSGRGVVQIIVVLGVAGGIPASRVVRGAVIGVKENAYFQAAQAIGARTLRTLVRHVLPNIAAPLIVVFSINVGSVIIAEASLSFLGFGLPATVPSWGGMLSREGRQYMEIAPRLALWPGLCLTVTVYALNLFGDAVRDLLDPRLRGAAGRYGGVRRRSRTPRRG